MSDGKNEKSGILCQGDSVQGDYAAGILYQRDLVQGDCQIEPQKASCVRGQMSKGHISKRPCVKRSIVKKAMCHKVTCQKVRCKKRLKVLKAICDEGQRS